MSHSPKTRGTPADLEALILAYRRGELTQEEAAKRYRIRKATFAKLATEHAMAAILSQREETDGVRWRAFLRRFLVSFPQCDPRAVRRESRPGLNGDNLWRPFPEQPVTTYTAEEAAHLPPSAGKLDQSGTGTRHLWENSRSDTVRSPATIARALARDTGQQQLDESEPEELSFDGPEFEFEEAA